MKEVFLWVWYIRALQGHETERRPICITSLIAPTALCALGPVHGAQNSTTDKLRDAKLWKDWKWFVESVHKALCVHKDCQEDKLATDAKNIIQWLYLLSSTWGSCVSNRVTLSSPDVNGQRWTGRMPVRGILLMINKFTYGAGCS